MVTSVPLFSHIFQFSTHFSTIFFTCPPDKFQILQLLFSILPITSALQSAYFPHHGFLNDLFTCNSFPHQPHSMGAFQSQRFFLGRMGPSKLVLKKFYARLLPTIIEQSRQCGSLKKSGHSIGNSAL